MLTPGPRKATTNFSDIKLALFDVDNTLVDNESSELPTENFIQNAKQLKGKVRIGIASARPIKKVAHIMDAIDADGVSILNNGAQLYDCKKRKVIAEWIIPLEAVEKITALLRDMGVHFWINDDGVDYFPNDNGAGELPYSTQSDMWDRNSDQETVAGYAPAKPFVIVADDITEDHADKLIAYAENDLSEYGVTTLIAHETLQADGSKLFSLFFVHKSANKKNALHEALSYQELSADEVLMVGDGRNDAVIVEATGIGVAMGNSAQETLDVATHIAPDQKDDGAATVLAQLTLHT